ncbi:MAG TPA: hypothetical protein DC047_12615 [Blastocatellia bacterium]|nr:hypothetical protein [Blastocatellia bacterium]
MKSPVARLKLITLLLIPVAISLGYFGSSASYTKSPEPGNDVAQLLLIPVPFPTTGFDYPQPASTVEQWVSTRNESRAREHGWYLWAGLNTPAPDGSPVWRTWPTSTQAFAKSGSGARALSGRPVNRQLSINAKRLANASTTGKDPINFPNPPYYPIPSQVKQKYPQCVGPLTPAPDGVLVQQLLDGPTFQNNGDIMVAGVIYDEDAFQWIRGQKLYLAQTLNNQMPIPPATSAISPMPPGSIVLKPMMWPVQGSGYTAVPVWDDLNPDADDGKYVGFEVQKKWKRAVAVTPRPTSGIARASATYLYGVYYNKMLGSKQIGPLTYKDAQVVPVQNFYYFRFPNLKTMASCDRAILDASAYWAYNREFRKDDFLVLVAMHVLTKEQPDWTFQSVWWHDKPNDGSYAANRPNIPVSQAPGPWRHYLLTSTYGITQHPGGKQWPIAYNPYIELAADHPIATNCMNCHHRAAWTAPPASYLAKGKGAPDALDVYSSTNAIFNGLLTVDSIWSISDRAIAAGRLQGRGR